INVIQGSILFRMPVHLEETQIFIKMVKRKDLKKK
ncbi:unnamed protein product, partial [marine sediment metagenome]